MTQARMAKRAWLALPLLGLFWCAGACRTERATPRLCAEILDRIIELELHERGFRDPALLQRTRDELGHELAPELMACAGMPVRPDTLACVARAASTEALSHRCLR